QSPRAPGIEGRRRCLFRHSAVEAGGPYRRVRMVSRYGTDTVWMRFTPQGFPRSRSRARRSQRSTTSPRSMPGVSTTPASADRFGDVLAVEQHALAVGCRGKRDPQAGVEEAGQSRVVLPADVRALRRQRDRPVDGAGVHDGESETPGELARDRTLARAGGTI